MEKYPIIINNETVGEVSVLREGAKTHFRAECKMIEGIVRLAVFGAGKKEYLGVLTPKGDRLCLERSFSRSELRAFPEKIEYAALHDEVPRKKAMEKEAGGVSWKRSCDGALYCMRGARSLVALPVEDKRLAGQRFARTVIGNREYAVLSPEVYRVLK